MTSENNLSRICPSCQITFPLNEKCFYKRKHNKMGLDSICKDCRRSKTNKYKNKKKALGLCKSCLSKKLKHSNLCQECWLKSRSISILGSKDRWQELADLITNAVCPYTGTKLEPGLNLSFDHVKPKSKFPDLIHDITNIVSCRKDINMAKWIFTPEQFISICKEVAAYHS